MSKTELSVDASKVHSMLDGLTGKEVHTVLVGTVRKGAKKLQKQTEEEFKALKTKNRGGKGNLTASTRGYGKVATIKVFTKTASPFATVSIGSRSADFRAKFFELGTKPRYTKGHRIVGRLQHGRRTYLKRSGRRGYRGEITAGGYFRRSQQRTEQEVMAAMQADAINIIKRIWRKKQKQSSR